eukprot:360002-Chlamydomonas_euryale.AAC.3
MCAWMPAGIAPSGNGAACVNVAPGGGMSFRCRDCFLPGYQPFKDASAISFWIKVSGMLRVIVLLAAILELCIACRMVGQLRALGAWTLNLAKQRKHQRVCVVHARWTGADAGHQGVEVTEWSMDKSVCLLLLLLLLLLFCCVHYCTNWNAPCAHAEHAMECVKAEDAA